MSHSRSSVCCAWFHVGFDQRTILIYGQDAFLLRVKNPEHIRHLALSLPLHKADLESLSGTSQYSQADLDKSVEFFKELQSRGRWRVPLKLKTLTLVFADPVMFDGRASAGKGVRAFSEIETGNDFQLKRMLLDAITDCENVFRLTRSAPGHPRASWGNPDFQLRIADRGDFLPEE